MSQIGFNMGLGLNYGMNGLNGMYGYGNMSFGYGNMNSMMNGMLNGGNYGSYGGYGGFGGFGGFGGYMGMNGSMSLPLYQYSNGQAWDTTLATNLGRRDPVYLDTNRDGKLNVEKLQTPLSFDMNGDGIADRVLEWNTKDAQLVYDANGDGQINSGREMMNEVGINGEQGKYKNGWEKALDLFDTNKDGKLDAEELKKAGFWTDSNGNGKVDEGELKNAAEMGIMGIDPKNGQFIQRDKIGNMNINFGIGGGFGGNYGGGFGNYGNYGSYGSYGNYGGFGNLMAMNNSSYAYGDLGFRFGNGGLSGFSANLGFGNQYSYNSPYFSPNAFGFTAMQNGF